MRIKLSCIYLITCVADGKMYVGQSIDYYRRQKEHVRRLKANNHSNPHLQHCFDKHGEDSFEFNILEVCSVDELDTWEQLYLDDYIKQYGDLVINILIKDVKSRKGIKQTPEHTAKIKEANKGRDVSYLQSEEAKAKRRESRKGHEVSDETKKKLSTKFGKPFILISPLGETVEGIGLTTFAKENGLNQAHLLHVTQGKRYSCKGWRKYNPTLVGKEYDTKDSSSRTISSKVKSFKLLSPIGEVVTGENLSSFARANDLDQRLLHMVVTGKRKSHKGWSINTPLYKVVI